MTGNELIILKENRLENETINQTRERLIQEGKFSEKLPVPAKKEVEEISSQNELEEGFSSEDLIIPRLKIVQPTSRIEGAKEGCFYNTLTGEQKEKLENIVFLTRQNGRTLFAENDFSGEKLCWSYDGLVPAREQILKQTGEEPKSPCCMTRNNGQKAIQCPYAMWNNDPKENGSRAPKCKETITFLGLDEYITPFWILFSGTGIPPVKNLIGSVYLKKKQAMLQGKEIHLRDFRLSITLKLQMSEKGKFYYPVFQNMSQIMDEKVREMFTQCYEALGRKKVEEVVEVEEKVTS